LAQLNESTTLGNKTLRNRNFNFGIDSGTANTYVVTLNPPVTAYTAGMMIYFIATNPNSGASTVAVDGLTAVPMKKAVSTDLASGDILDNQIICCIYDGTIFQLI